MVYGNKLTWEVLLLGFLHFWYWDLVIRFLEVLCRWGYHNSFLSFHIGCIWFGKANHEAQS